MSANISPVITPVAAAGQFALNGTNANDGANGASGAAGTSGADGGAGSFARLFQQMAGKQLSDAAGENRAVPNVDALQADTTTATDGAAGSLDAMLPFLEAMGLAQSDKPTGSADGKVIDAKSARDETTVGDPATSVIAQPVVPAITPPVIADPAISAAQTAENGNGHDGAARQTQPLLAAGAGKEAQSQAALKATTGSDQSQAPLAVATSSDQPRTEPVQEFSTRLVHALENSQPQTQAPEGENAARAAQTAAVAAPAPASQAGTKSLAVTPTVGSPGWSEAVGSQVVWMANRHENRAELVLNPPHMGRVEVSLTVSGDQATASFVSANPHVRDALEAALPRLRETLADAGIQLGQAQVGAENARQSAQQEKNGDNPGLGRDPGGNEASSRVTGSIPPASAALKAGRGLVDVFA